MKRSHLQMLAVFGLTVSVLTACGSPQLEPTPRPTPNVTRPSEGSAIAASPTASIERKQCDSGNLMIQDLPLMDATFQSGLAAASTKAETWQQDAVVTSLSVACQLFESSFRWQVIFYSRNAQAFFASDTGEVTPSGFENEVPALDVGKLSFTLLRDALLNAGYTDDTIISPSSGVDIRLNSVTAPFGPPEAPKDVILYHVTIERLGEVRDLFVNANDGTVYIY